MRPVRRGDSPRIDNYSDYTDAKTELISRIGFYCSYCERKISTNLAVEHIEPKKGVYGRPELKGSWTNFLLACVNCNSTKGDKQVVFDKLFFPDRDNTFFAFEYLADGRIVPAHSLNSQQEMIANTTLSLLGLDKELRESYDDRGNLIAQDRAGQRMQAWGIAESCLDDYLNNLNIPSVKKLIVQNMEATGFFSVWMTVFNDCQEMKKLFIAAISGTRESGCFDSCTGETMSPHPNKDSLLAGSKV